MPLEFALQHKDVFPRADQWKQAPAVSLPLKKPLGLTIMPKRVLEKAKKRAYTFNIATVGETGLGKTTFLNTLFNTNLTESIAPEFPQKTKTVAVEARSFELIEDGVTLNLTVVDTPGFGDRLDRAKDLEPIDVYLTEQFERYYQAEQSKEVRRVINDTRIHACLYFLAPTGKRLRRFDVEAMKTLATKVNLIPVIARADSMTTEEITAFKHLVLEDLNHHDIPIYVPTDLDDNPQLQQLTDRMPFSVIGSDLFVPSQDESNRNVRARSYKWGIVEVENAQHCNFHHLRECLMTHCLHDLIESTHRKHFAAYRRTTLRSLGRPESILLCDESYESRVEQTKQSLEGEMARKEEEMRRDFVLRVRETEKVLKEREEALNQKRAELNNEIEQMRHELEAEHNELQQLEHHARGSLSSAGVGSSTAKFGFGKGR